MISPRWMPLRLVLRNFRTGDKSPRCINMDVISTSASVRWCASNTNEAPKKKIRKYHSGFIDSIRMHVKAGTGGQGLPTNGGSGGRGGDIIAVGAKDKDFSLKDVIKKFPKKRVTGPTGSDSRFFCLYGENGKSTAVTVPLGITVMSEEGHKIGEINTAGEQIVIAKGGNGGCAANGFTSQKGQTYNITLDLKLIADVGFVGFPNAGKSTLLKAISQAKPKVASYPFTTVMPNVGVLEFPDYRKISLADLPGLIEGAHANMGMGHKFLKHVERTKLLLFVVDMHGFQLGPKYPIRSALETIVLLNKELELYNGDLTEKPVILALNKSDKANSYKIIQEVMSTLQDEDRFLEFLDSLPENFRPLSPIKFDKIVPISAAKDMQSVNTLKKIIRRQIDVNEEYQVLQQQRLSRSVK